MYRERKRQCETRARWKEKALGARKRWGGNAGSGMNVLIYVRTINNHHKYFGRHISRLVCQHWSPPFAIPCVFNHAEEGGRDATWHPPVWRTWRFPNTSFRLIKIIMSDHSFKFSQNLAIPRDRLVFSNNLLYFVE